VTFELISGWLAFVVLLVVATILLQRREKRIRDLEIQLVEARASAATLIGEETAEIHKEQILLQAQLAEHARMHDEMVYVVNGAGCLVWHGDVKFRDGAYYWDIKVYNREILNEFLPLKIPPGMTWEDAWYESRLPEDRARTAGVADAALIAGRSGYSQDFRCVRADGGIQWIHEDARIRQVEKDRWRIVGLCTNITDRKQRETELMQIFKAARCIIWHSVVEEQPGRPCLRWELKVFNEQGVSDFCPVPVVPGKGWREAFYEAIPSEDRQRMDTRAERSFRTNAPGYSQEFRCMRPDGMEQWLHEDVRIERVKEGRWYAVGVITDITERKQAEEDLRRVIASARCLLWHAFVEEKDGSYKWQIKAVGEDKILEIVPDLLLAEGRSAADVFFEGRPEEDQRRMDEAAARALRGNQRSYSQEFRVPCKDGKWRWIFEDAFIQPVGPGRWHIVGVSTDINARKQAEQEREKLIGELRDALAKVKLLSGLLPICAACKKVRDDDGYWNQIDTYIRDHADVEFSHSICPDCAHRLYPEFNEGA
jgi:PAS domain-containing protein